MKHKMDTHAHDIEMESGRPPKHSRSEDPPNSFQQPKKRARYNLRPRDRVKKIYCGNKRSSAVQHGNEKPEYTTLTIHPFLRMPTELRLAIYRYCLVKDCIIIINDLPAIGTSEVHAEGETGISKDKIKSLLLTSKQIHAEASEVLYGVNKFQFNLTRFSRSLFGGGPTSDRYENCFSCFSDVSQRRIRHLNLVFCVYGLYEVEGTIKDVNYWMPLLSGLVSLKIAVSVDYFIFNLRLRYEKLPLHPHIARVTYGQHLSDVLAPWPDEIRIWLDLLVQATNPHLKIMVHNGGGGPETQAVIDETLEGRYENAKLYDTIKSEEDWKNVERGLV